MPRMPKKPCSYHGCPRLTDGTYCEEHGKLV
ncbi:MAG: HNH endonuclease, partial [Lachnospiraceae bacterium]|nr:HNH endonuclease [Lachnospiraceae bacterium]